MIDIHSHVLYGIDDGAKTLDESIAILKKMSELGYTKVIATPHYIDNTEYVANNKKKKELLTELTDKLKEENIKIELFLGNEIFIEDNLLKKMIDQEIYTLNNTNYILLELPLLEKCDYSLDIIYELVRRGVKVVLAHPERYITFQKDKKMIDKYLELGVLFQGNISSLIGKYGKNAQKLFIKLLKAKKYFALASDIHTSDSSLFKEFDLIKKKIIRYTSEEYFDDLLIKNPEKILNNQKPNVED